MPSLLTTMPWVTKALWVGGVGTALTAGVIVPVGLSASSSPGDVLPEIELPADPEQITLQLGIRDLMQAAGMVLGVHEIQNASWVVFWTSDNSARGEVNANEIAVIGFNSLMHSLELYTTDSTDVFSLSDAIDDSFIRTWRKRRNVNKQIIALGLQDVRFVWSDISLGRGKLRVSLIWDQPTSDVHFDPLGEPVRSSFTVSLPGVQGTPKT
jgi:hypothetical protein